MDEMKNQDVTNKNLEDFSSESFKDFIGINYEYYNKKWRKINIKNPLSLNWMALFFGPVWFAYRKMYIYLFAFFGGLIAVDLLFSFVFNIDLPQAPFTVAAVMIGLYANSLYLYFVRKKIRQIKIKEQNEEKINEQIKKTGGVSIISAVIISAIMAISAVLYIIDLIR